MLKQRYIIIAILLCLYFNIGLKNKAFSQQTSIDYTSPIIEAVQNRQKALQENNIEELWCGWTGLTRQERWKDYEDFTKWLIRTPEVKLISGASIQKIEFITPNRVLVKMSYESPTFPGFYLINELGEWKFGLVRIYIKRVKKDLEMLRTILMKYFADIKEFPSDLSQLIPIYVGGIPYDPFSDEDKAYLYIRSKDGFVLYSVGPDGKDDLGRIEYMSEKRLFSKGDVIITEKSESIK